MINGRYLKIIGINAAVSIAVVLLLWLVSCFSDKLETREAVKLSELNAALLSEAAINKRLSEEQQLNLELQKQLDEYSDSFINKDILLRELSAIVNDKKVEVVSFSEASQGDEETFEDLISVKRFRITLYGDNGVLHKALLELKAIRKSHKITESLWLSDYAAGISTKISGKTTLIEALSDRRFVEIHKLGLLEFTDKSLLSFTIEFSYPKELSPNIGGD